MHNLKVQGFFLLDVDVVALNNAGLSNISNNENVVATKKVYKNNKPYAYISGQAFGAWWRDTLQKQLNWELSPILREAKTAFTAANPFLYPDDDVFGYMKAAKEGLVDEDTGEIQTNAKGKQKMEDVTVTRAAPLKKSAIVSVGPVSLARNWSSMSRHEGDAVPYFKEEYSAIMKGQFSLALDQVGTFSTYNRTGFKNLTDPLREHALANGCEEVDDPYVLNGKGLPHKLVRLPKEQILQRAIDAIQALLVISGGAMQTNNMADVTPKFLILACTTSGNHPFGLICTEKFQNPAPLEETEGARDYGNVIQFRVAAIKEVLKDYRKQIVGTVFIGRRMGFLDQYAEELQGLENLPQGQPIVKIGSIGEALEGFCAELKNHYL
jgi:CRISPR-associated protein Cst2